ncbi:MAG TPA: NADH-quinone oxidoreductase subunit C [Myxococcota bacterium]|nr:NADH-quinone oxidoreductase subunit C [Myxococcota bacterium]
MLMLKNSQAVPFADIPHTTMGEWLRIVMDATQAGYGLSALFAVKDGERHQVFTVLSSREQHRIGVVRTTIGQAYPALTTDFPAAHWFERELYEQYGIEPEGHPWLKPIRFEPSVIPGRYVPDIGMAPFFEMEGQEVHEVGVGPVHAGVIEPGHFRFQCHGETVHHLEISLGYQHRGIERALVGGPGPRTIHLVETAAGDATVGHTDPFCRAIEALAGVEPGLHARTVRAIGTELERLACHCGDLGALAGDVGFLPTQNYCGRIRGDILNLTALICGNRFGRGLAVPCGTRHSLEPGRCLLLLNRLDDIKRDLEDAIPLMFETPSVMNRMEGTGIVTPETAKAIGLVGPAARASGLPYDVRWDLDWEPWSHLDFKVPTCQSGDCAARARIRWAEIQVSIEIVNKLVSGILEGDDTGAAADCAINGDSLPDLCPDHFVVSMAEGWRGQICHVASTDSSGRFSFYKIVDPSFHNWFGLAMSLRNQQISDFPLCNKSFNLSYCGHDL